MNLARFRAACRVLHRDLGYLFFGLTIVYAVSGLAINHLRDWNPNYSITRREATISSPPPGAPFARADAEAALRAAGIDAPYQSHYFPSPEQTKVFFKGGNATLARSTGRIVTEELRSRPLLHTFNRLHYNPGVWWTWFADTFSVALIIIAVTGLFLLRGRHGITRRGGLLVAAGVLVPGAFVFFLL